MERRLAKWLQEMLERHELVFTQLQIRQKACRMIKERNRRTGFRASRGWLENF